MGGTANRQRKRPGEEPSPGSLRCRFAKTSVRNNPITPCSRQEENMRCRLPFVACLALFFAGCSNEPYQVAPVSGRITVDGKPVERAAVMFQPVAPAGN